MDEDRGAPLEASVAEQLAAKARLEETARAERRADERQHERVGRRKAAERATVLEHTRGERRLRPPRAGRRASRPGAPLPLRPLAALAGAVVLLSGRRRRGRLARFLVPLVAASLVLAVLRGWTPAAAAR